MVNRPDSNKARQTRHKRVRAKISGTAECPRLNVFRSLQNIYAQLIDDVKGVTLVSASTSMVQRAILALYHHSYLQTQALSILTPRTIVQLLVLQPHRRLMALT